MLNIILGALPALGSLLGLGKADALIAAGSKVALEVFGTTKEDEIATKLQTDPALGEQFKAKLAAETEALQIESRNYELQVQDAANARAAQQAMVEKASPIAWAPVVVTGLVLAGFIGLSFLAMKPETTNVRADVVLYLLGAWQSLAAGVVYYWVGSSAGSAHKDRVIQTISAENTSSAAKVAAKVVEAAKTATATGR